MPGRKFSGSNNYRYGFNGQEKDDEISGNGNANTAAFWEYDTRLGRRWNRDPVTDISVSPYACFNDNPILYNDVNGDTKGDPITQKLPQVRTAINIYRAVKFLKDAINVSKLAQSVPAYTRYLLSHLEGMDVYDAKLMANGNILYGGTDAAEHELYYEAYLLNKYKGYDIVEAYALIKQARVLNAEKADKEKTEVDPTKNRVKLRKGTNEKIKENQEKNEEGEPIDPNDKKPLGDDKTDVGHRPGNEWWRRKEYHKQKGSSREQVIEEENNPDLYQIERRSNNRSHQYEKPKGE